MYVRQITVIIQLLFTLGALYKIQVFTDDELKSGLTPLWAGTAYNSSSLNSVNELILNETTSIDAVTVVFKVILQPVRNIYMRSPNLSSFNTMDCNGESSIIKQINVNANPGDMIFSNSISGSDFLDCSHATWRTVEISITDINNGEINLRSANWSFSFIFAIMNSGQ